MWAHSTLPLPYRRQRHLGVQSRSVVESAMLMLHSGRPYGTNSSRQRQDHARRPSCYTAIEGFDPRARQRNARNADSGGCEVNCADSRCFLFVSQDTSGFSRLPKTLGFYVCIGKQGKLVSRLSACVSECYDKLVAASVNASVRPALVAAKSAICFWKLGPIRTAPSAIGEGRRLDSVAGVLFKIFR
jgi:hypothetical protein